VAGGMSGRTAVGDLAVTIPRSFVYTRDEFAFCYALEDNSLPSH